MKEKSLPMRTITFHLQIWLVLLLVGTAPLLGQNSKLYMVEHGLSSSRLKSLYQDQDGFIWVASENGLDRLIGDHFRSFPHLDEDPLSISNMDITDLRMDVNGYLWVGTGKGLNRYSSKTNQFEHFQLSELDIYPDRSFSISGIVEYSKPGWMAVGTSGHGLYIIDIKNGAVDTILSNRITRLIGTTFIGELLVDSRKWLWTQTGDKGFCIVDLKSMRRIQLNTDPELQKIISRELISNIVSDNRTGNILIGTASNGLFIYDAAQRRLRRPGDPALQTMNVQSLLVKKDGTILIGSENRGIWIFNRATETIQPLYVSNNNLVDLEHSKVHALMEDNMGNLWVGLYQKGLFLIPKSNSGLDYHVVSNDGSGKNSACVSGFARDPKGNLWISTDGGGVFQSDGSNLNRLFDRNEGLTCHSMVCMAVDKNGTIWTGSYGHGLYYSKGGAFAQPAFNSELSNNRIMCLEYDPLRNYLYVGTNGGRFEIVDLTTGQLHHVNTPINRWVRALHVDRTGRLWIGTSEGTYYYDVDRGKLLNVDIGIAAYHPTNCFEEVGDNLYIGMRIGLLKYDMKSNKNSLVELGDVVDSRNIMALAAGNNESLWFTTPKNLSRLNLKTGKLRTYSSFEGFLIGEFRYGSAMKDASGTILFGGDNGYIRLDPEVMNRQQYQMRPIFFTALSINNVQVDYSPTGKNRKRLDASLTQATRLKLRYKENSFTLHFSAQEFGNPQKVNYSYRLTGYEDLWHQTDASNAKAAYASLPPGRYTFEVKGYFNEESDNVTIRKIRVIVANPWYSSVVARFFYFILVVFLLYLTYLFYRNKQDQRRELEMAQYNEQVKEDKLRLFTSIAHEIRTPLTLIVSPLKKLMNSVSDSETSEMYNLMFRNSMRILKTINQLLDIRKIDNGQLKLHFKEMELIGLIKSIMLSFKNMATVKQISFSMESSESDHLNVWMDGSHFDKIIYNILSNAFKFTPFAGKILIRVRCINNTDILSDANIGELAEIRIFNTGKTISETDLERIFERFYQGGQSSEITGSGIGLHVTKELVLLHHGQIEAHNVGNEGVEFIVRIPLGNAHLTDEELSPSNQEHESNSAEEKELEIQSDKDYIESLPTSEEGEEKEFKGKFNILVVDDDEDFCRYLKKELTDYNILTSNSGNQAWKQLLSVHPDVVVTDYLMPDGDGLELCQRIKNNPETDSIPVIILTSENSEILQMQSMQLHADRFLTKPFNILLLKGAIGQALRVREKIRNKMHRTEMGYNYDSIAMDSADDKLVKKVIEYIKDHLEDSEMSVEELSREVGFSRVHLNRKLKEILGMSPSNLIKSIRLKQAAYLLVNNKVNISEVAYKVGFSSHSYFSYNFHDFFGMSPKEFVIYYTENPDEESIRKLLE